MSTGATIDPNQEAYDSDEERDQAHHMFIEDISTVRKCFLQNMDKVLLEQDEQANSFAEERSFFLRSIDDKDKRIAYLEN